MLGFVAPDLHTQPCPNTATYRRHPQQHTFGNPPAWPLRLPLVDAVQEKRDDVNDHKVKDDDCDKGNILHGVYFFILMLIVIYINLNLHTRDAANLQLFLNKNYSDKLFLLRIILKEK